MMKIHILRKRLAFAVLGLAIGMSAGATELRDIINQAIENGKAGGILTGPMATMISARTGSLSPPIAVVETVGSFASPECKRVRVTVMQTDVKNKKGLLVGVTLPPFELNMCLNGQPPTETLTTPEAQKRVLQLRQRQTDSEHSR